MTLAVYYKSKKELKENIGNRLIYSETSMFDSEYKHNGTVFASNRPQLTGVKGREFFAEIHITNGLIASVK